MRILSVQFSNLNSLYGKWKIDFTAPDYEDNGLFAITGPTGSGKSTILDAITLALYGSTPRLGKVTSGGNDIMSRLASNCSAEVVFQCARGTFRVVWQQHRANKSSEGNLQNARWEICEHFTGEVLAEKSATPQKVEELTSLDFERFTRTVLLAQGGFASFLKAKAKDRSPLLENISGTAIYTDLSSLTFNAAKQQKEKLDLLREKISSVDIMHDDQEVNVRMQIDELRRKAVANQDALTRSENAIIWLTAVAGYREDLQRVGKEADELDQDVARFAIKKPVLLNAQRALSMSPLYEGIKEKRDQIKETQKKLAEQNKKLPIAKERVRSSDIALQEAQKKLSGAEEAELKTRPTIIRVREIDSSLSVLRNETATKQSMIAQQTADLNKTVEEQMRLRTQLTEAGTKRKVLEKKMDEQDCDDALVTDLSSYKLKIEAADAKVLEIEQLAQKQKEVQKQIEALRAQQTDVNEEIAQHRKTENGFKTEKTLKERELIKLLGTENEESIRGEFDKFSEKINASQLLREKIVELLGKYDNIEKEKSKLDKIYNAQKLVSVRLTGLSQTLKDKYALVETIRESVAFQNQVMELEELRSKLANGRPCPLCGAIHHPYAASLNLDTKAEDKLARAIEEAASVAEEERRANEENTRCITEIKFLEEYSLRLNQETEALKETICEKAAELEISGLRGRKPFTWEAVVKQRENIFTNRKNDLSGKLAKISAAKTAIAQYAASLEDIKNKIDAAAARNHECDTEIKKNETLCQTYAEGERQAKAQRDEIVRSLEKIFQHYGLNSTSMPQLRQHYTILEKRCKTWLEQKNELAELNSQIERDTSVQTQVNQHCEEIQKQIDVITADVTALSLRIKQINKDRLELFGTQHPDEVDKELKDAVSSARTALYEAVKNSETHKITLTEIESVLTKYEAEITAFEGDLEQKEAEFTAALSANGFANEGQFFAARIPDAQREAMQQQSDDLDRRSAAIKARLDEYTAKLNAELAKNLTHEAKAELEERRDKIKAELAADNATLSALEERIRINDDAKSKLGAIKVRMEEQKKVSEHWDRLNALIGSASGDKFRTFAQGLTFELLVDYANRQLASITPRYTLITNPEAPLDLQIIDDYQEGRIRSIENLSGGESFLVSLSLALGMSQMTGRKARVDSLFLDEGFGTLDNELLHTALEALSKLHQQGKLIGIISHVQELKENIPVKIEVIRESSGQSRLVGPGVRRIL